ncbi:hypothetical protein CDO47_35740 [Pseudomonas aeruginosa]|nr:hypothetical protein CDO47_35740 [Pseudomonas aeruginosa]
MHDPQLALHDLNLRVCAFACADLATPKDPHQFASPDTAQAAGRGYFPSPHQSWRRWHGHAVVRGEVAGLLVLVACHALGCVDRCNSLWFFGRYGFELADAKPLPFQPMKGQLGFFEVEVAQ